MGPQAKVLVDTGHHYQAQNIEQIVAWLLDEDMLGGFHFNDRRYADDDLTLGSIDPYQVFRIFSEIHGYAASKGGEYPDIEYMVDQSHNLKPKMEAMIETVTAAQELYAKAALVDHAQLEGHQERGEISRCGAPFEAGIWDRRQRSDCRMASRPRSGGRSAHFLP